MNCVFRLFPLALATLLLGFSAVSQSYTRADLLALMQSGNPEDRAVARQHLPRFGVVRLQDIIPVLGHANEAVWRTASNVLTDIANEVSAPGREDERQILSDALLKSLGEGPSKPKAEAARVMDIVHLALPEGANVAPIARYLRDPELQMNARNALQLAGTSEAKVALRDALEFAEGKLELAVMDSLGILQDAEARGLLVKRIKGSDPVVRAAAARAYAWSGDLSVVADYKKAAKTASRETASAAGDAFLLYVDAVVRNGGNFDLAMDLYEWALDEFRDPALKGAALASMGRFGDERVVPLALKAASGEEAGALDHAALEALAQLQGYATSKAIHTRHDELLEAFGPTIYAVYGQRGDEMFLPLLLEAIEQDDEYTRHAAKLALLDTNHPEGIRAVAAYGEKLEGEARDDLVNTLELKAVHYQKEHNPTAAAAAYTGLYRLATNDKTRNFALAGIMRYPSEEAFGLVKDLIGTDKLNDLPVTFLAGVARAFQRADRKEDADKIIDSVVPRIRSANDLQAVLASVQDPGPGFAQKLGFVTTWHVLGPFPWNASDGLNLNHVDPNHVDLDGAVGDRNWKSHTTGPDGTLNLIAAAGNHTNAVAYAYAELQSAEAQDVILGIGSDDGVKIWLNGDPVHENHVDRGLVPDQDQAPAKLKPGKNHLLAVVTQGAGGWAFCLRITRPDGAPNPLK